MKNLIVFYSRTGTTKKMAEKMAKILKADIDEIVDRKNRKGIIRWLLAGRDAMKKKTTEITFKKDPSKYSLVILGTPTWAGLPSPAIRTYLTKNKFKKLAFFCTMGGKNHSKVFIEMESISKKPIATLAVQGRTLNDSEQNIVSFIRKISSK
jgi:flavodoxin